jgi:hypothetical protein
MQFAHFASIMIALLVSLFFFNPQISSAAEVQPIVSLTSPVQKIPLSNGDNLDYAAEITSGPINKVSIEKQESLIGINAKGEETAPIEKVIVAKKGAQKSELEELKLDIEKVSPNSDPTHIKTLSIDEGAAGNWFEKEDKQNDKVFTVVRFLLNGSSIGVTLVYSSGVPISKAFLIGLLTGSMSGALQYKVGAFRNWIRAHILSSNFGLPPHDTDDAVTAWGKTFYNYSLELTEEFGKFGLTEFAYTSLMTTVMVLLRTGNLPPGLYQNFRRVVRVVSQSTFSQGTADLGLFKDLDMQTQYGGWSEDEADFFRNAAAFTISALSVAISAFQVVNPGVAGEVPLFFFNMPYGFAAISVSGLLFYMHGLFAEWQSSPSSVPWIPLDFGD